MPCDALPALDKLRAMLACIDPTTRDYWIKVAMALKAGYGDTDEMYFMWDAWSAEARTYNRVAANQVWRSIRAEGGVGVGTLIHLARHGGYSGKQPFVWKPDPCEQAERAERERKAAEVKIQQQAKGAQMAKEIWEAASLAPADHPYLMTKGVRVHGLRLHHDGRLLVPIMIHGELASLQFIASDSGKLFLPGGKTKGGSCVIGDLNGATIIALAEGWATSASIHEATGYSCVAAFSAGNLQAVAEQLRHDHPDAILCLCADNDVR